MNQLTAKEIRVITHLSTGKSNKQIAFDLSMAEATVKVHVKHILRKLGCQNRTQAALCWLKLLSAQQSTSNALPMTEQKEESTPCE